MVDPATSAPSTARFAPDPDDDDSGSDGSVVVEGRDSPMPFSRVGRYRAHVRSGRRRQIHLRYSEHEYNAVTRAAHATGLTATGYVAEAALAAATCAEPPTTAPWRAALTELMEARTQVRRIGLNINQAARVLNAAGEPPVWLEHALAMSDRAVGRLDDAATALATLAHRESAQRSRAAGLDTQFSKVPSQASGGRANAQPSCRQPGPWSAS